MDKTRVALLTTLGVMLLRLPVGWGIQLLLPNAQEDPAIFYARLIIQELLLWGLPALIMLPWRTRRLVVDKRWVKVSLCAVVIGLMAQMALMAVTDWWTGLTGSAGAVMLLPQNEIQWVLAVLALVVIPALTEEAFFRGGLLTGLCDSMNFVPAAALTTLIFALMHGSLGGFPAHLGVSLLCSLAMLCRGRLRVPVLIHMSYNASALLLRNAQPSLMPALPLGLILVAAAMWMCGEVIWRRRFRRVRIADAGLVCAIVLGAAAMYIPEIL